MDTITQHKQVADYWPTRKAFADAIGVEQNIVRRWILRDSIPPRYWVRVVNACHEIDAPMTYKLLAELCQIDQ